MIAFGSAGSSQAVETEFRTYVYKKVGDLEIRADTHRPAGDTLSPPPSGFTEER